MEARLSARATSLRVLMALVAVAFCSTPSVAENNRQDNRLYTVPVEPAQAPKQWRDFCKRHPDDCRADSAVAAIKLTASAWGKLDAINRLANRSVTPRTDQAHWHEEDRWDYPDDGYGDCEDYALLKRRLLIEAGLPAGALMLTVVWTRQQNGHAVLLVRTDKGEFVLDSENPQIRHWAKTGYRFVKRQRAGHPHEWVYIDGDSHQPEAVSWSSAGSSSAEAN
jgi:predicted transglutaminase-like cysteine proteinase